jgi:peptidoglycan hydrolase-like protein with peptidoglycan-binding domain
MAPSGLWLKSAFGSAGTAILVCSVAFAPAFASGPNPGPAHRTAPAKSKTSATSTARAISKSKSAKSKRTSTQTRASRKGVRSKKGYRRGQQKIDSERTYQIQEALIRKHYMTGEPSGKWDASTEDALRRFQADHGWQNKTVPDSRALIRLGLGPNHDHLLNPESAMTTAPETRSGAPTPASTPAPTGPLVPASEPQP